jgi:NAD(P)-dependent dehydrogenase (short-subunit alcohol dehydrogenase family)
MNGLDGKVALVTGGASGIGRATAQRLATEGVSVVVTDIQDDMGEQVAAGIRDTGGRAVYFHHDVAQEDEWTAVIRQTLDEFGRLDVLVNNAGIGDLAAIEETTIADYDRTIAITQTSVFLGMKAAADALKQSANASVINVSSIFGASGGFGTSPAYHAAKGAVRLMTKNIALRWATQGVRVNSVHPGFIATPILDQAMGTEVEDAMVAMTPMERLGRPEEVAAAITFLASDDASFMTGSEVYIDGGYTAR